MRNLVLSFLFLFVSATTLSALEGEASGAPLVEVVPQVVENAAPAGELHLTKVQVERRAVADDAAAAQFAARGSFWWIVGVIVVAGVILAVLL